MTRAAAMWLLLFATRPTAARADEPPAHVETARALFEQGRQLAGEDRLAEAERAFEQSLELVPRPNTRYNLAILRYRMRRFAACMHTLDGFLERTDPVRDAEVRTSALELRALASKYVGLVIVRVSPATAVVSGADFTGAGAQRVAFLDAGTYKIVVSAPLRAPRELELNVQPGRSQRLAIGLTRAATAVRAAGEDAPRDVWPWVLTTAGGALLAGAVVTGLLALDADREVTSECPPGQPCERLELRSAQARAESLASATDALWITGALSASIGVGWLLLANDSGRDDKAVMVSGRGVRLAF